MLNTTKRTKTKRKSVDMSEFKNELSAIIKEIDNCKGCYDLSQKKGKAMRLLDQWCEKLRAACVSNETYLAHKACEVGNKEAVLYWLRQLDRAVSLVILLNK